MQLLALDQGKSILARFAEKKKIYSCPECASSVRLRSGPHRKAHFYHIRRTSHCRQQEKTLAHLQVQMRVSELLPQDEAVLENPFPERRRIADVAWESGKIIFEIQCSPISLEEASARAKDYSELGYTLVWILHEKRFNQKKMSAAERFIRQNLCFFTNIDESGKGIIYDQQEIVQGYRRVYKGPPLEVDIQNPIKLNAPLKEKILKKKFSFSGIYHVFLRFALENV